MALLVSEMTAGLTSAEEIQELRRINQELERKLATKERELQVIKETVENFVKKNVCHVVSRYHEREFVRNKLSRNFNVLLRTIFESLDNLGPSKLTEIINKVSHRFGAILASEKDSEAVDHFFESVHRDKSSKLSMIFDALHVGHAQTWDKIAQDSQLVQLKQEADEAIRSLLGIKALKANVSKKRAFGFALKMYFFIEFIHLFAGPGSRSKQHLLDFARRKCELEYNRFQGTLWQLYDERNELFTDFRKKLKNGDPASEELSECLCQVEVLWTAEILISKAWHVALRIIDGQSDIYAMKELRDLSDEISTTIETMHRFVAKWFFITEDTFEISKLYLIQALVGAVILCNDDMDEHEQVERWQTVSKDYQEGMRNLSQVEQILWQQLESFRSGGNMRSQKEIRGLLELCRVRAFGAIRKHWLSEGIMGTNEGAEDTSGNTEQEVLLEKKRRKQSPPQSPKDDGKKRRKKGEPVPYSKEEITKSMKKCFEVFMRAQTDVMRLIGSEVKIFVPKHRVCLQRTLPGPLLTRAEQHVQPGLSQQLLDSLADEGFNEPLLELDLDRLGIRDTTWASDADSNASRDTPNREHNHSVSCEICLGQGEGPCEFQQWFEANFKATEDGVVVVEFMCDRYRMMTEGYTVEEIYAERNNRNTENDEPFYDKLLSHLHVNRQLRPTRKRKDENWYKTERHIRAIRNGKKTYEQLGQYIKGWQPRDDSFFQSYFDALVRMAETD